MRFPNMVARRQFLMGDERYNFRVLSFFGKYLFLDAPKCSVGLYYVFYCKV